MVNKLVFNLAVLMGAIGIAIGAFGAHALDPILEEVGKSELWHTALQYYWIHTLALLFLSLLNQSVFKNANLLSLVPNIWVGSVLIFSGSLAAIALGASGKLGMITPIGGLGFITGWILLLFLRTKPENTGSEST